MYFYTEKYSCNVTIHSSVIEDTCQQLEQLVSYIVLYLHHMCESTVLKQSWKYIWSNVYAVVGLLATTFDLAVTTYNMVVAAENAGNVKGLPTHFYTPL